MYEINQQYERHIYWLMTEDIHLFIKNIIRDTLTGYSKYTNITDDNSIYMSFMVYIKGDQMTGENNWESIFK